MNVKKVISDEDLKLKINEAIKLICNPTKRTLGPKGCNSIVDPLDLAPFITNDGVTIASNIASDDVAVNTILEIIKEASIKTNELVGDGTTTTLVLLESIYNAITKLILQGKNPIILKEELETATKEVVNLLNNKSKKPSLKNLQSIASIAAKNKEIGKNIADAYKKVGPGIYLEESLDEKTSIVFNKGYQFETLLASPYFLKSQDEIIYSNPYILVTNEEINSANISAILKFIFDTKSSLIIIAKDYDDYFLNNILNDYLENTANIILLKSPGYGLEELNILEDIATISDGNLMSNNFCVSSLGKVPQIKINKEITTIEFNPSPKLNSYLKTLSKNTSSVRKNMLTKGSVTIKIGSPTSTETKEKKMHYEDALWAINIAKDGVLPGSGITLYEISDNLPNKTNGYQILKEALKAPLNQILLNAGISPDTIISKIRTINFTKIYNVMTNTYEDIKTTEIIDPSLVIITALKNAVSIASILATTTSLIINEQAPISKEDFNL